MLKLEEIILIRNKTYVEEKIFLLLLIISIRV